MPGPRQEAYEKYNKNAAGWRRKAGLENLIGSAIGTLLTRGMAERDAQAKAERAAAALGAINPEWGNPEMARALGENQGLANLFGTDMQMKQDEAQDRRRFEQTGELGKLNLQLEREQGERAYQQREQQFGQSQEAEQGRYTQQNEADRIKYGTPEEQAERRKSEDQLTGLRIKNAQAEASQYLNSNREMQPPVEFWTSKGATKEEAEFYASQPWPAQEITEHIRNVVNSAQVRETQRANKESEKLQGDELKRRQSNDRLKEAGFLFSQVKNSQDQEAEANKFMENNWPFLDEALVEQWRQGNVQAVIRRAQQAAAAEVMFGGNPFSLLQQVMQGGQGGQPQQPQQPQGQPSQADLEQILRQTGAIQED